jgi:hypothetical protein
MLSKFFLAVGLQRVGVLKTRSRMVSQSGVPVQFIPIAKHCDAPAQLVRIHAVECADRSYEALEIHLVDYHPFFVGHGLVSLSEWYVRVNSLPACMAKPYAFWWLVFGVYRFDYRISPKQLVVFLPDFFVFVLPAAEEIGTNEPATAVLVANKKMDAIDVQISIIAAACRTAAEVAGSLVSVEIESHYSVFGHSLSPFSSLRVFSVALARVRPRPVGGLH